MNALLTDRYELAMLASYVREGIAQRRAVFELSVRRLPPHRRFLVVSGMDRLAAFLRDLRFTPEDIAYLREAPGLRNALSPEVLQAFENFRCTADVDAMADGEVLFAGEPILRVRGTLAEAQLLETFLLGVVNHEVRVASKAARVAIAAKGRPVFEFGARRGDPLAAPRSALAAWIGGCAATSCEQAGRLYGVPVAGTLAHSYVLAHVDGGEEEAFRAFAETFSEGTSLLIDTFDTRRGALRAANAGGAVNALRIDSGDLERLGCDVRTLLDAAGRKDVQLIASDDMDEYRIETLLSKGVPYDAFGVGTAIVLSPDAPSLGAIYKLVEVEDRRGQLVPVAKRTPGKDSYAGAKQVYRRKNQDGMLVEDFVTLEHEAAPEGTFPLLKPLVRNGIPVDSADSRTQARRARTYAQEQLAHLPPAMKRIDREESPHLSEVFSVFVSDGLKRLVPRGD